MTPSPESRAREVVRSLMEPLDNGKPYLETPMRKVMVEVIAAAIREAENAKIDSASRLLVEAADHIKPSPYDIAAGAFQRGLETGSEIVLKLKD